MVSFKSKEAFFGEDLLRRFSHSLAKLQAAGVRQGRGSGAPAGRRLVGRIQNMRANT